MKTHRKLLTKTLAFAAIAALAVVGTGAALTPETVGPPETPPTDEAVVQVYGADVWGLRGYFAIHTWVATKPKGARTYTIYQVIGWHLGRRGTTLSVSEGPPNVPWFRSPPMLLHEVTGHAAEALIDKVDAAAHSYPYAREYVMWPGPNSNSFTEWIALEVPELGLELPAKAIGKEWMQDTYPTLLD